MKLKMWILAFVSLSSVAAAQEYSIRPTDFSRLKSPRADMSPAVFAGHAAFMDLAKSIKTIELAPDAQGTPQFVVKTNNGAEVFFHRIENHENIFQTDISASPMTVYPEGRLLLSVDQEKPSLARLDNPVLSATLYIVGKFPFADWGYGDVDTPKMYSDARWMGLSSEFLGVRESRDHCDPRFPCNPQVFYRYRASFQNSLTGETLVEIQELGRRL